jgi:hypothetical protein
MDLIKARHHNCNKHPSIIHFSLNNALLNIQEGFLNNVQLKMGWFLIVFMNTLSIQIFLALII